MPRKIEDLKIAADAFWIKSYDLAVNSRDYSYLRAAMQQCNLVDQELIRERQLKWAEENAIYDE